MIPPAPVLNCLEYSKSGPARCARVMTTYTITFEDGPTFRCESGCAVSIAMKRAGVRATTVGCRGGGCGVCRVRIVDGRFHTGKMSREHVSEADEAAGYALGCRLYPESDLVLAVAPKPVTGPAN